MGHFHALRLKRVTIRHAKAAHTTKELRLDTRRPCHPYGIFNNFNKHKKFKIMAKLCLASELAPKRTTSVLIYGQPSAGKTTLGCSASNAVLFDYDGGVHRIHPSHMIPTLQVESWEDTAEALKMINSDPQFSGVRTIVIDTVGKMLDYMSETIIRADYKMRDKNGMLALKGYGVRKKMFVDFLHSLSAKGYNVVFIAHEKEEKDGETTIKRPLVGGSSTNDLLQELDLVGYMQYKGAKRFLSFNATEQYYAKNSCFIQDAEVPVVLDAYGTPTAANNYMDEIFAAFRKAQQAKLDLTKEYNALLQDINATLAEVKDVEALTAAAQTIGAKAPIFDSRIKARAAVAAKAQELGAKWDANEKRYVC